MLVVEDHEDLRELIGTILREEGYTVVEAANGAEGLDALARLKDAPCLVLLDMMMPVMDGKEFLATLHASHRLAVLPVVVVSASGVKSVDGAQRVVKKPAPPDVIVRLVREFCKE